MPKRVRQRPLAQQKLRTFTFGRSTMMAFPSELRSLSFSDS